MKSLKSAMLLSAFAIAMVSAFATTLLGSNKLASQEYYVDENSICQEVPSALACDNLGDPTCTYNPPGQAQGFVNVSESRTMGTCSTGTITHSQNSGKLN